VPAADFTFRDGERLIRFAEGAVREASELIEAKGLGGYVLLTTERALGSAPAPLQRGAEVVLNVPHGPVPQAAAAVRDAVSGRPVVALGGGRVIDAAKAVAGADGLRCAAIPTTLAGSSFTPFHRMPAGVANPTFVRPGLVLCDPTLMASAPMSGLAATAMNALAHAVESLYAPGANPVAEGAALRAASLFARGLPADPPVAEDVALAAVLAGWAVGNTGLAVHHALCQTIVREAGTPHAQTNAVILPHTVAFMAERAPGALARLGGALLVAGDDSVEAAREEEVAGEGEVAATRVAELAALAGPRTLADLGAGEDRILAIASAAAAHPGTAATPGGVTEEDLLELLSRAL
jgi:alcohol dehydrogenase class IV